MLAVLEHDVGFDARTADMIVGTSAGSVTPLSGEDGVLRQMAKAPLPELAPFRPLTLLRRPLRPPLRGQ